MTLCFASAQTTDNMLWTAVQVQKDVTKKLMLSLDVEARFDQNVSRLRSAFGQFEIYWKFNKYLATSIDYRYGGKQSEKLSEFSKGHRLSFFVYGKYKYKRFTLSDRIGYFNQYLVNALADKVNPQKYFRNKTQLKYELTRKLAPFVYFEFFYRVSGNKQEVDQNRFAGGFDFDFNKKHNVKLQYIYLTDVNVKIKNKDIRNIISAGYTFKF